MRKLMMIGAAAGLVSSACAQAQDVFYWPAPAMNGQATQKLFFEAGTPLMLRTRTEVSTRDAKPGDRLYLEVAESLSYEGQVVIPVGAPAVAEVVRSDRTGHFGRKGKVDIRLLHVQTPGGPIRLTGEAADQGVDHAALSIGTFVLVSPLGFLIRGTSARIPFGTTVQAHLAEPLRFTPGTSLAAGTGASGVGAVRR
jgi:hypothetical protein